MSNRTVAFVVAVSLCLLGQSWLCAQRLESDQHGPTLQQRYLAAQNAEKLGNLEEAAKDYRAGLAQALTELAEAYVLAGDVSRTSSLLDDALALSREPAVLLPAARASLMDGQFDRARSLATELIASGTQQRELLAEAHHVLGRVLLKRQEDKEARKEFEIAVALDSTFANGYDLAVACLDLGDEACAVQVFGEIERALGDTAELHVAFGKAYGNSDFQPRAVTEFRRAIVEDPKRPGTHYLLAAVLLANGGDESARVEAEQELMAELRISPHDALSYATLGQIALVRTDYPKAVELLKKAILYGPQLPEGYLYLGQAYFNTGKFDEAAEALRTSIRLTSDVSRNRYQVQKAHYLLGRILSQQHQPEAAHAEMQISRDLADKALALDKSRLASVLQTAHPNVLQIELPPTDTSTALKTAARGGNASAEALRLEVELRPALADGYNNLGVIAASRSDFVKATESFRHAAEWEPNLTGLDYNWGRAAFAGNLYAEAIGPLSRYTAAHPDDTGARSVLALSEFETGNYQGCVDALQPVAARPELAPQVRYAYAQSLVKSGHVPEGIERLTVLAQENPQVSEIQRALAEARALLSSTSPQNE